MKTIIDTATDTYLIQFKNKANGGLICNYEDITEALKLLKQGYFLKDIFRYNQSKRKFERVPKNKYNSVFGWNTEAIEVLTKYI